MLVSLVVPEQGRSGKAWNGYLTDGTRILSLADFSKVTNGSVQHTFVSLPVQAPLHIFIFVLVLKVKIRSVGDPVHVELCSMSASYNIGRGWLLADQSLSRRIITKPATMVMQREGGVENGVSHTSTHHLQNMTIDSEVGFYFFLSD